MANVKFNVCHIKDIHSELDRIISSVQKDFKPVTVITPSTTSLRSLRHSVGTNGLFNVRFTTMSKIAADISTDYFHENGITPLHRPVRIAAIRKITHNMPGPLAIFKDSHEFIESLNVAFHELSTTNINDLRRYSISHGTHLTNSILDAYEEFIDITKGFYDTNALLNKATDIIITGSADTIDKFGSIIFCLPWNYSPHEISFMNAIMNINGGNILVGKVDDISDSILANITSNSDSSNSENNPISLIENTSINMLLSNDATEEIREITRNIFSASEEGVPFYRMAIIYPKEFPYLQLIEDELTLAQIPIFNPSGKKFITTLPGKTLLGLIELIGSNFPRRNVMEFLTNYPINLNSLTSSPIEWDSITRAAGIRYNFSEWQDKLYKLINKKTDSLNQINSGKSDIEPTDYNFVSEYIHEIQRLNEFIYTFYHDLSPEGLSKWSEYASWLSNLFIKYIDAKQLNDKDTELFNTIIERVNSLSILDGIETEISYEAFKDGIIDLLEANSGQIGRYGSGVFVGKMESALGMKFDYSYITGVNEGQLPLIRVNQPFISDNLREAVGGMKSGITTRKENELLQRFAFLSVIKSSSKCFISACRGDFVQQRASYPSKWFLEIASILAGFKVTSNDWGKLIESNWLTSIPSRLSAIRSAGKRTHSSLYEFDLFSFDQWFRKNKRLNNNPLIDSTHPINSAIKTKVNRASDSFTEWDGDISNALNINDEIKKIKEIPLSPTMMETYATCPYRYFLKYIAKIKKMESPEETPSTIDAKDQGTLLHKIFEKFHSSIIDNNNHPDKGKRWSEEVRELMVNIGNESFQEWEEEGLINPGTYWELDKEKMMTLIEAYLNEDYILRSQFNSLTTHVELPFGWAADSPSETNWEAPEIDIPGIGNIKFRGIIDRIDINDEDNTAIILDLKTGSTIPFEELNTDIFAAGKKLQLPIYLLASKKNLPDTNAIAAYWMVGFKGGYQLIPNEQPNLEEIESELSSVLENIVKGMTNGLYPPNPGPENYNCSFCDYDQICPQGREVFWNKKIQNDIRLSKYLDLKKSNNDDQD